VDALRSRPELRRPFFDGLTDPAWAWAFHTSGFLYTRDPEDLELEVYLSTYLSAVAPQIPDLLPEVLKKTRPRTHGALAALMHAVVRLPVDRAAECVPSLASWLEGSGGLLLLDEVLFQLIDALIHEKLLEAALPLIKVAIGPPLGLAQAGKEEARTLYKLWTETLDNVRERLTPLAQSIASGNAQGVVELLEETLMLALRIGSPWDLAEVDVKRGFWRSAIEDTDQDRHDEVRDFLLVMLRDLLIAWLHVGRQEAVARVDQYLRSEVGILRRLGVHLVSAAPQVCSDALERLLTDPSSYSDLTIHHEFFHLLRTTVTGWPVRLREEVVRLILSGPDQIQALKHAKWVRDHQADLDLDAEAARYARHWTLDRLWMLRGHIDVDADARLSTLVSEFGEPKHSEFLVWSSGAVWVGEAAPVTTEELAKLTPGQVIDVLTSWSPDAATADALRPPPTRAGLAAAFETIVKIHPLQWTNCAPELMRAPLHPEYYYHYVRGLQAALEEGAELPIPSVVALCEQVVQRDQSSDPPAVRGEVSQCGLDFEVIDLLGSCAEAGKGGSTQESIRTLLIQLAHSVDPGADIDSAETAAEKRVDPALVALNHVRPKAIAALIDGCASEKRRGASDGLNERVKALLETRLAHEDESSLGCHSVFGKYFRTLLWLDSSWLLGRLELIFPEDPSPTSRKYFQAAFDSFLLWGGGLPVDAYAALRPKFKYALSLYLPAGASQAEGHREEATRALAACVLLAYSLGLEELPVGARGPSQEMLGLFYDQASPELRGIAVWNLWRRLNDAPDEYLRGNSLERLMRLWEWRVECAVASSFSQEFDREIQWFGHWPRLLESVLPEARVIELIRRMLPHIARDWGTTRELGGYLLEVADHNPMLALSVLQELHEVGERMGVSMRPGHGHERALLLKALEFSSQSRRQALEMINWLGRRGTWHRDLYNQYRE